ncbi:MAG: hypothetical protein ABI609_17755 [Acidobacteriota bacterium]
MRLLGSLASVVYLLVRSGQLALLCAAFWGTGRFAAVLLRPFWPSGCGLADRVALGMGVWMAYVFVLAASSAVGVVSLLAPLAGALGWLALWGVRRLRIRLPSLPIAETLCAAGFALVLGGLLIRAAYPSVAWDAAVYHLTLPKLMLQQGGFAHIGRNFQSFWPVNTELLYAVALAWGGPGLASMMHWACGALLMGAFVRTARRYGSSPAATAVGAALLLGNQIVLNEMGMAYVDLTFALMFFLAFAAVLRALDGEEAGRNLLWAGVLCGLLCGVKLTGVLACVAIGGLWVLGGWGAGRPAREVAGGVLRLALPAMLLLAPWLVRLWHETGNPIYPFAFPRLGGVEWSSTLAGELRAYRDATGMGRSGLDFLLLPLRVLLSSFTGLGGFDGAISPLWLAALPAGLWASRASPLARRSLGAAALYFAGWAVITQHMRFLITILPLLALASTVALDRGLANLAEHRRRMAQRVACLAAATIVLVAGWDDLRVAGRDAALIARHGFELERLLVPPVYRFLDQSTPRESKVLFLNTNKGFYCNREFVADAVFQSSQIADWLRPLADKSAVLGELHAAGITHILFEDVDWGIRYPPALIELLADPALAQPVYRSDDRRFTVLEVR